MGIWSRTHDTHLGHPLLQTLVTYEIIQHLPRSDALNCRLVCRIWDTEVCRLLRKRLTLEFDDLCQVNRFHALLDKFEEAEGSRDLPFARIHLCPSFRLGHTLAQEFFKSHGHVIRHLTILKVGCDCGANFFQKLLFYQAINLSSLNLQKIGAPIGLSPESGYRGHKRALEYPLPPALELPYLRHLNLRHQLFVERSLFIKELLQAVINLEYLTTDATSPEFCSEVFLPTILNSPNSWSKLKKLSCGSYLTLSNKQLQDLSTRKIQLKEISLLFNHSSSSTLEPMDQDNLLIFLKHNKETLKRLELNNRQADLSFEMDSIPKMPKLEYLRLTNVSLEPKWLEMLPKLSSFEIYDEEPSGLCIPLTNINLALTYPPMMSHLVLSPMCILNIRDLNDMGLWWDVNGHLYIRKLSEAFPRLKSLSINGNDSILKAIYDNLPLLESLNIHGPVTDEGITGIQLDVCEMMLFEQSYHSVNFNVLPYFPVLSPRGL